MIFSSFLSSSTSTLSSLSLFCSNFEFNLFGNAGKRLGLAPNRFADDDVVVVDVVDDDEGDCKTFVLLLPAGELVTFDVVDVLDNFPNVLELFAGNVVVVVVAESDNNSCNSFESIA